MGTPIERLRFAKILRDIAPESELSPRGLGRLPTSPGSSFTFYSLRGMEKGMARPYSVL